jgi:hypothetical protein
MMNVDLKYDVNKRIPGKKVKYFTFIVVGVSVGAFWTISFIVAVRPSHNKLPFGIETNIPDSTHIYQDTAAVKKEMP